MKAILFIFMVLVQVGVGADERRLFLLHLHTAEKNTSR